MKRSEINGLLRAAEACFREHHWALPPQPRWDVTDFGLGDWHRHGLVLVNLADQAEYCEKLMYTRAGMVTPCHCHHRKQEDIICRWGELSVRAWPALPTECQDRPFPLLVTSAKAVRTQPGNHSGCKPVGRRAGGLDAGPQRPAPP